MQTNLTIFKFEERQVRTVEIDGEIYFVGKDVCDILGYQNSRKAIADHCLEGVTKSYTIKYVVNTVINESGLYQLILGSRMPNAVKFKSWVTSEVLPSIRKTGKFEIKPSPILPDFTNPAVAARAWADEYEGKIEAQKQLEEQKPKVEYAEAMGGATNAVDLGDFAKTYSTNTGNRIGRNTLFDLLRQKGVFMPGKNVPKQKFINAGLFVVNQFLVESINELKFKTLVTPAGEEWLIKKLNVHFGSGK